MKKYQLKILVICGLIIWGLVPQEVQAKRKGLLKKQVWLKREPAYQRFQRSFYFARRPLLKEFRSDSLMIGSCASYLRPNQRYEADLNIYVEANNVLGRSVYVVPNISRERKSSLRLKLNSIDKAVTYHNSQRKKLVRYTSLQEYQPNASLAASMVAKKLGDALLFSKNRKVDKKKSKREEFFRLRILQAEKGSGPVLVEKLCPLYKGCARRKKKIVVKYGDPYLYCHFEPGFKFRSGTH